MKWVALLLLFLVACSLPQPVTEDTTVDVSETEIEESESAEKIEAEPVVETITEPDAKTVVVQSESDDGEVDVSAEEDEAESSIPVKISPITASVVGPPEEEKLVLGNSNVMDYLVELFAKNVHSYKFRTELGEFFVRGDKFKLILSTPTRYITKDEKTGVSTQHVVSTIYVNRNLKTATGYCEGKDTGIRRECEDKEILDVPRDLLFSEYNFKLPEDWLWGYLEKKVEAVETDKYYVNSKKAVRVFFAPSNDTQMDMFFDEKTGLPVKIISIKGKSSDTFDYIDLSANSVKDVDVVHRDLSDIPSEEYYK